MIANMLINTRRRQNAKKRKLKRNLLYSVKNLQHSHNLRPLETPVVEGNFFEQRMNWNPEPEQCAWNGNPDGLFCSSDENDVIPNYEILLLMQLLNLCYYFFHICNNNKLCT